MPRLPRPGRHHRVWHGTLHLDSDLLVNETGYIGDYMGVIWGSWKIKWKPLLLFRLEVQVYWHGSPGWKRMKVINAPCVEERAAGFETARNSYFVSRDPQFFFRISSALSLTILSPDLPSPQIAWNYKICCHPDHHDYHHRHHRHHHLQGRVERKEGVSIMHGRPHHHDHLPPHLAGRCTLQPQPQSASQL